MKVKFDAGKLARYFSVNDKEAIRRHLKDANGFDSKKAKDFADLMFEVLQEITNIDPKAFFTKEQYNKLAELADKLEIERDQADAKILSLQNKNTYLDEKLDEMFEVVQHLAKHLALE